MRDIVEWIVEVERLAGEFYFKASAMFGENDSIRRFLEHSAEDEAWHFHAMGNALNHLQKLNLHEPFISVDEVVREKIEGPFRANLEKMKTGLFTERDLIECVYETEFSEWNDIFLFVVNMLKNEVREYYYSAARMQHHMRHAQHFLESTEYGAEKVKELKKLDKVFEENILIVEDNEAVSFLLERILSDEGNIDTAENGGEGLKKLGEKYYKVIISDIDMPKMDGIEFYKKAVGMYPDISTKFIFHTGSISEERVEFFRKNNVKCMLKPQPIRELKRNVLNIMHGFE